MLRFVTFVDGSNLDGVLKHLNLRVDDYGSFYRHVFEQSVHYWGRTFAEGSPLIDVTVPQLKAAWQQPLRW